MVKLKRYHIVKLKKNFELFPFQKEPNEKPIYFCLLANLPPSLWQLILKFMARETKYIYFFGFKYQLLNLDKEHNYLMKFSLTYFKMTVLRSTVKCGTS